MNMGKGRPATRGAAFSRTPCAAWDRTAKGRAQARPFVFHQAARGG
ncbi:hypothetical protein ANDA3_3256 [plant metagenome]|uniref:Uncharacterized protein n=1 Tax=plant metagenome TaxID=1297885 RepID=A0A484P5U0_9ZZZZ